MQEAGCSLSPAFLNQPDQPTGTAAVCWILMGLNRNDDHVQTNCRTAESNSPLSWHLSRHGITLTGALEAQWATRGSLFLMRYRCAHQLITISASKAVQACRTGYSNSSDEKWGESLPWASKQGKSASRRTRNTSCKPCRFAGANPRVLKSSWRAKPIIWWGYEGEMEKLEDKIYEVWEGVTFSVRGLNIKWEVGQNCQKWDICARTRTLWAYKNLLAAASLTEEAELVHSVWVIKFFQAWGVFLRLGIRRNLSLFCIFKKYILII